MAHLYLVDSAVTTVFKFSCNVLPRGEGVDSVTVPAVAVHVVASVRSHAVWNMLLGTLGTSWAPDRLYIYKAR